MGVLVEKEPKCIGLQQAHDWAVRLSMLRQICRWARQELGILKVELVINIKGGSAAHTRRLRRICDDVVVVCKVYSQRALEP
jgi:hypothetical protein